MEKKTYLAPQIEVFASEEADIIATSGDAQPTSQNEEYETENANPIWF